MKIKANVTTGILILCSGFFCQGYAMAKEEKVETVNVVLSPDHLEHSINRQFLGQATFYSWQSYAWDYQNKRSFPAALKMFEDLGMGIVGHYPGVGVITHDFRWKNLIGPLSSRKDPTEKHFRFDSPLHLQFGPDEYGRFIEEYRKTSGRSVDGSIQVNIVNGTASEAADWVEYMNAPNDGSNPGGGKDWAAERAANGHSKPYGIKYWEMGNEPHFTAEKIGHLTAQEYARRVTDFSKEMKGRDPGIETLAYVNPFLIGDPSTLGTATADVAAIEGLTWSQFVINKAGEDFDHLYFHWYGGWNDRRHDYKFTVTSMQRGLIPLLDRILADVEKHAPSESARKRLSEKIFIPEWNPYGGWSRPLAKGTALLGALAYSRTLHVFASRKEVYSAQHLALLCPFPKPKIRGGFILDFREGYCAIRAKEDGKNYVGTAQYEVAKMWSRAFNPSVIRASVSQAPKFVGGSTALDVTALASKSGDSINVVITNAKKSPVDVKLSAKNFAIAPDAEISTITSSKLSDNNSWNNRKTILASSSKITTGGADLTVRLAPYSINTIFLIRAM